MKLSWKLSNIKLVNGEYHLTYETPEGLVSVRSKSVMLTVPSHVASILLRPLSVSTIVSLVVARQLSNQECINCHFALSWVCASFVPAGAWK